MEEVARWGESAERRDPLEEAVESPDQLAAKEEYQWAAQEPVLARRLGLALLPGVHWDH